MSLAIISFDIESDGKLPFANMWELGMVAYDAETKKEIDAFAVLINTRENVHGDPETLDWIIRNNLDEKYQKCVTGAAHSPESAMNNVYRFLLGIKSKYQKIQFVASPSAYDFPYLYEYYVQYGPQTPEAQNLMPFKATCLSSMFNFMFANMNPEVQKNIWKEWAGEYEHTHNALDDAREQGNVYLNLVNARKNSSVTTAWTVGIFCTVFAAGVLIGKWF